MFTNNSFDVQVTSSTNIFPESTQGGGIFVPLSIFDNASAGFARCAAAWFYDPPSSPASVLSASHLQISLSKTLNYYRQWCGCLSYATPKPNGSHNHRYQRIWVTYNTSTDIGIPFVTAKSPKSLSKFLPSISTRRFSLKAWDASQLPAAELLPKSKLSVSEDRDAPNVIIQFTTFACGSTAVAIEITHCFADAVSLSRFAKDWSHMSRCMFRNEHLPALTPIFDSQRLDSFAAGDIDTFSPDPSIVTKARSLPQHRYDWHLQVQGQPWPTHTPADFDTSLTLSPSTPIPWHQWDTKATISHHVLHFTPQEILNIYSLATSPSSVTPLKNLQTRCTLSPYLEPHHPRTPNPGKHNSVSRHDVWSPTTRLASSARLFPRESNYTYRYPLHRCLFTSINFFSCTNDPENTCNFHTRSSGKPSP